MCNYKMDPLLKLHRWDLLASHYFLTNGMVYIISPNPRFHLVSSPPTSQLWHRPLGHLSNKVLYFLSHNVPGISLLNFAHCFTCPLAKQTRLVLPNSHISSHAPFEKLHVDIWGGYRVPSLNGSRYFLTIVDDYLMHMNIFNATQVWNTLLVTKFCEPCLKPIFNHFKIILSDNGSEFNFPSFYFKKCFIYQSSYISTPQQNGVSKFKHHHFLNVACPLFF